MAVRTKSPGVVRVRADEEDRGHLSWVALIKFDGGPGESVTEEVLGTVYGDNVDAAMFEVAHELEDVITWAREDGRLIALGEKVRRRDGSPGIFVVTGFGEDNPNFIEVVRKDGGVLAGSSRTFHAATLEVIG